MSEVEELAEEEAPPNPVYTAPSDAVAVADILIMVDVFIRVGF